MKCTLIRNHVLAFATVFILISGTALKSVHASSDSDLEWQDTLNDINYIENHGCVTDQIQTSLNSHPTFDVNVLLNAGVETVLTDIIHDSLKTTQYMCNLSDLFKFYESKGMNFNEADAYGITPLTTSVLESNDETTRLLAQMPQTTFINDLAHLAPNTPSYLDVLSNDSQGITCADCTIFEFAATFKADVLTVRALLDSKKVDINAGGSDGTTPLILAAGMGQLGIVNELLSHGANLNAKNAKGYTALLAAQQAPKHPDFSAVTGPGLWYPFESVSKQVRAQIVTTLQAAGAK